MRSTYIYRKDYVLLLVIYITKQYIIYKYIILGGDIYD